MAAIEPTFMPFLYPLFSSATSRRINRRALRSTIKAFESHHSCFHSSTRIAKETLAEQNARRRAVAFETIADDPLPREARRRRLDPPPDDYARNIFVDKCTIQIHAGSGGNGCVSFHRDAFISDGPPNGGDGGSGGNVWIQAVPGQMSLHKLARRGILKAGRGISGQGKGQGGRKGEDICIQVPVGTVVREIWRSDPVGDEEQRRAELQGMDPELAEIAAKENKGPRSNPFILYPGATGAEEKEVIESMPKAPKPRRSHHYTLQPPGPIRLDLDKPMDHPQLLVAGAVGGFGNPHFATKENLKPKIATKGELGTRIRFELELKLLADVGLVGLPNAGKSTLLRAISNSRTRIGDWAFTTLEPSIGTVILDNNEGRPMVQSGLAGHAPRTQFTVADIPGLVEDAHLDKGLGLGFLRHVERARILAFVIDLSAGHAVQTLQSLWREVAEYENLRNIEINEQTQQTPVEWTSFKEHTRSSDSGISGEDENGMLIYPEPSRKLEAIKLPPVSSKPWFVVATKADKPNTHEAFKDLQAYITGVKQGDVPHPCGKQNAWKDNIAVIPISAINDEGTDRIAQWTAGLLDSMQGAGQDMSIFAPHGTRDRY